MRAQGQPAVADTDVSLTPYNVNTMTLTAASGLSSIDLDRLKAETAADMLKTRDPVRPFVSHLSYRDGAHIRREGCVLKRNGRVRRYSPRMFDNQATVVVRMPYHGGYDLNIKVFRNGNLQMTGARSAEEGREAANLALGTVGGSVHRVRVQLMNCNFRISRRVNRHELHAVARDVYGMQSSFNPSIYPAVKIYYMYNSHGDGRCRGDQECSGSGPDACCKRVTLLVFSGKVSKPTSSAIITGAVTHDQIQAAYGWLRRAVQAHADAVLYPAPEAHSGEM
eukprot:jgi/Tetstr1/453972/TSEL_040891.t1